MRKLYVIILTVFTIYSCTKENHKTETKIKKENYSPTEYFSFPTDIKNWRNYTEIVINDSLKKVSGEFGDYMIKGYIDHNKQKIGWWNILDKQTDQADNARIEYRIIDKKEFVNQYISYNLKDGNDTINSLFYLREKLIKPNIVRYKFYTPNKKIKINMSGKFFISYFSNNKKLKTEDLKCFKKNNYYYVDIDFPTQGNNIVKGLFEEAYEYDNGEMGVNDMYILDTLK
ncbi:hypothetical protein H9Q08_05155 [Chryseobacterium sp. PS-8]|uniref:Uncharacterized protein n=1 Tax=Chryseobacterium indicum TaxID=2766954 RepID=A0ABS9C5V7_9FLAO|nr:hypothetical protein [Chryseobacterium sp. PS-8]MCF2218686.1 hypothetical protein [Chryseobacterium sp. PS-8]